MSAEQEIATLAQEVRTCTACTLCQSRQQAVAGEGSARARILFIGESPGFHEDRAGRPFVGPAGHFLEELLASIQLRRPDVFLTTIVKCRPPNNRDPRSDEIAACSPHLDRLISILRPELIVTLGRYSMTRFFSNERISEIHGQLRMVDGLRVLPLYHPAAGLHHTLLKQAIREDFQKIPLYLSKASEANPAPNLPAIIPSKPSQDEPPDPQLSLFL